MTTAKRLWTKFVIFCIFRKYVAANSLRKLTYAMSKKKYFDELAFRISSGVTRSLSQGGELGRGPLIVTQA